MGAQTLHAATKFTCRKEGHDVSVRVIYEKPDTERYVEEFLGLDSGAILVAAGGDGSINEASALQRA